MDTAYSGVVHGKLVGVLKLSFSELFFVVDAALEPFLSIPWNHIVKHQVSPVTYPKPLLKLILSHSVSGSTSCTFQLPHRDSLEQIRKDITSRLQSARASLEQAPNSKGNTNNNGNGIGSRKRLHPDTIAATTTTNNATSSGKSVRFYDLDSDALAVTRSTLLASNTKLRQQHQNLVTESQTLSEHDFWITHAALVEEEYARIVGLARAGTSSLLHSHIPASGKISLGVEEMRQIFIFYPAVHKAYEEKVPLELSGMIKFSFFFSL
jgi:transcription initiation factor TFIIH subunit 1